MRSGAAHGSPRPLPHDILPRICHHLAAEIVPPGLAHPPDYVHDRFVSLSPDSTSAVPRPCATVPRPSPTSTLLAVLLTGWHGYNAAMPHLYAQVPGDDLPAVYAGLAPNGDGEWPNAASRERKLTALRCVRRLNIGSWPGVGPAPPESDDDDDDDYDDDNYDDDDDDDDCERYDHKTHSYDWDAGLELEHEAAIAYDALLALQQSAPLFPRLDAVVFHCRAMLEDDFDGVFQRIAASPLYRLLCAERAQHICVYLPRWKKARLGRLVSPPQTPYIDFLHHLCSAWAQQPTTTTTPTPVIHNFDMFDPPLVGDDCCHGIPHVRLWTCIPAAVLNSDFRATLFNMDSPAAPFDTDVPWVPGLEPWYDVLGWVWKLSKGHSRTWEIAGVRPLAPLTCTRHTDAYVATAFWIRALLRTSLMRRLRDQDATPLVGLEMPFAAATDPCGACGAHFEGEETWWSEPLEDALVTLGPEAEAIGEQMKALDRAPRVEKGKGSCVSTSAGLR